MYILVSLYVTRKKTPNGSSITQCVHFTWTQLRQEQPRTHFLFKAVIKKPKVITYVN